jgi:hypothetical protein
MNMKWVVPARKPTSTNRDKETTEAQAGDLELINAPGSSPWVIREMIVEQVVTAEVIMEMVWKIVIPCPAKQMATPWVAIWGNDSAENSAIFRTNIIFFVLKTSSSGFFVYTCQTP